MAESNRFSRVPHSASGKRNLSPARRQLIALLQNLNFGRLEQLHARGGEPVLSPMPRVVKEIKFAGDNGPRPEARRSEFSLKPQLDDLLHLLDRIGDGVITELTVKNGLPFHAELPG